MALASSNDQIDASTMDTQSDNSMTGDGEKRQSASSSSSTHPQDAESTLGMIPRLVSCLFDTLYDATPADSSIEYSLRCSYVEIYLEKMTDLLHPGRVDGALRIGRTVLDRDDEDVCVLGATELCCLCPEDVYALLARGQATRTKSAEDANIDSSRSHAVFTLHLEQIDVVTGKVTRSRLQVIDCAGSQTRPTTNETDAATSTENSMMNASLGSLHNAVRWRKEQQEKPSRIDDKLPSGSLSKIAALLQPSIGGTTHTVMICTGAPSSYTIDDTIHAIRFAQVVREIRNQPQAKLEGYTLQMYRSKLTSAARKEQQLTRLITMMAHEAKHGKKKSREPKNPKVWDAILQICDADKKKQKKNGSESKKKKKKEKNKDEDDDLCISCYNESEQQSEIQDLYSKIIELESNLQRERTSREKAESRNRDIRSELAALKSRNQNLVKENRALEAQLSEAKAQAKSVSMQKTVVEHRLRTSLFRENEAVLFLRQLRTFYFRLLKNKAAQGSGSTKEAIQEAKKRLPGVADLEDLLDVDKMMVQSGIIESSEVGGDTLVADYSPSSEALAKSSMEAEMAEKRELEMIHQQLDGENGLPGTGDHVSITNHEAKTKNGLTYGQLSACRQKLLNTPAGLLAIQKEKELEQELSDLSKKCIGLQNSVNAEKAMVEALSGRQGAVNKMKQAQEVIMLKTELERRTNDLLAIVWKMNELHLVNKTIDTKVGTREQHVMYLEDHISDIQATTQRALSQKDICEKKLREENARLREQLEGIGLNLWQLGENLDKAPVWRLTIPYNGEDINLDEFPECRQSIGDLTEEEIDDLVEEVAPQCREFAEF